MIKLTQVESKVSNAPAIFLIPGGPGMSSSTLRSLDLLSRSFHLCYVDLPGTNGVPFEEWSLNELVDAIATEIKAVGRRVFVLGHSFGGFLAAEAAMKSGVAAGVICVATPFSRECQEAAGENYVDAMTPELKAATDQWERSPSEKSFRDWLSNYGGMYFTATKIAEGTRLLSSDKCSFQLFQTLRPEARNSELVLSRLKEWGGVKLSIAGSHDGLLPVKIMKRDAARGDFSFAAVSDASHFVTFDQPETVARLVEDFCATAERTL